MNLEHRRRVEETMTPEMARSRDFCKVPESSQSFWFVPKHGIYNVKLISRSLIFLFIPPHIPQVRSYSPIIFSEHFHEQSNIRS